MKVLEKSYTFEILAPEHKPDIIRIFNYYVENSFAAYSTVVLGDEVFDRFHDMAEGLPFIVISYNNSEIVGFAFLHPYHAADAFSKTAEITYFIMPEHTGKGLASNILERFIMQAKEMGISVILANISSLNDESIKFHRKHGFVECGRFRNIGRKFNKDFDVVWMQLNIE